MGSFLRVLSYVARRGKDLRFTRGGHAVVMLTGVLAGAASVGFIALINAVTGREVVA